MQAVLFVRKVCKVGILVALSDDVRAMDGI